MCLELVLNLFTFLAKVLEFLHLEIEGCENIYFRGSSDKRRNGSDSVNSDIPFDRFSLRRFAI